MEKNSNLFFVSTPYHLINASVIAYDLAKESDCTLIFIDQPYKKKSVYVDFVKLWEYSPFVNVHIFYSKGKNEKGKYKYRKNVLRKIEKLILKYKPNVIYTGNDRRIEFIRGFTKMKSMNPRSKCIYFDDGLLSYVVHEYGWESFLEIFFKKLYYGFWYNRQQIVGGSDFIDMSIISFPDFCHYKLINKPSKKINYSNLNNKEFQDFANIIFNGYEEDSRELKKLDMVLILPHLKELKKFKNHYYNIKKVFNQISGGHIRIGIKYHPFHYQDSFKFYENKSFKLISPDIPFELITLILKPKTIILGDVSTVLLTAKSLRQDLKVISIKNPKDSRQEKINELSSKIGIEKLDSINGIIKILEQRNN